MEEPLLQKSRVIVEVDTLEPLWNSDKVTVINEHFLYLMLNECKYSTINPFTSMCPI